MSKVADSSGGSELSNTNEAIHLLLEFLFEGNSVLTWVHLAIGAACVGVVILSMRLDPQRLPRSFKCAAFARDIIGMVQGNAKALLPTFLIGFALFLVGVALEEVPSVPSLLVQVLTYMPTIVLTLFQLVSMHSAVRVVGKYTGL
jgi:hypothetical protein